MREGKGIFSEQYIGKSAHDFVPDIYRGHQDKYVDPRSDQYGLMKAADELGIARPRRVVIRAKIGK